VEEIESLLPDFLSNFDGPCSVCIACNKLFGSEKSPKFTDDRILPLIELSVRRGLVDFLDGPEMSDEFRSSFVANNRSRSLILVLNKAGRVSVGLSQETKEPGKPDRKKNRQESSGNLLDFLED